MEYDLSVTDSVELHYFKKLKSIIHYSPLYVYAGIKFISLLGSYSATIGPSPKGVQPLASIRP